MLTVHSVYTVGLHDNIGTWYTSNEKNVCIIWQTLVMITHDETIAQMADRVIMIADGKDGELE